MELPGLRGYLEACSETPERAFLEVLAHEVAGALQSVVARSRDLLTLYEVDQALKARPTWTGSWKAFWSASAPGPRPKGEGCSS